LKASTGTLSLGNSGGAVTLRDSTGADVSTFMYGGSTGLRGDRGQSLTRSPDITGSFTLHETAPNGAGRLFSAGTHVDGMPFAATPAITHIEVFPQSATISRGSQQQFIARAFGAAGEEITDVIFRWRTTDVAIASVDPTGLATGSAAGITQIFAAARGVESTVSAFLTVAVATPTPTPVPSPSPSPSASLSPSPTPSVSPSPLPSP